ncbi:unnamed protein product [Sympodiomycopsis kandeliae]
MQLLSAASFAVFSALSLVGAAPISSPASDSALSERAPASVKIVGTTHCTSYATGHLSLVSTPGQHTTTPLTVADDSLEKFSSAHGGKQIPLTFLTCDSKFMGFKNTDSKKYGIVRFQSAAGAQKCVTAYHAPKATEGTAVFLVNEDCTYSDDSGQIQQYFQYDVATGDIIFLGREKQDYFAGSAYRYSLTPHGQVLGIESGRDGSHFHLTKTDGHGHGH